MSVQVWKDPNSDGLRIQYDEDGPIYALEDDVDPAAGADEVDHVPHDWTELVPENAERTVPVSKLRALATYLEDLAKRGEFWTPRLDDPGQHKAGAQALADSAARIEALIATGDFK